MTLLERESVLTELGERLREAGQGRGGLLFLGGEAGVGKSALVRHFRAGLHPPARACLGACDPLSTPRPLGPLLDLGDAIGGGGGPAGGAAQRRAPAA
jgi:predicted ATPase